MHFERSAGLLLHLTSLPGDYGIGDLGEAAHRFVDYLAAAGQSYWQVLPLGPNDHGSPYVAQSTWAGSPFLVSLDELLREGDLTDDEVRAARVPHGAHVDFDRVRQTRAALLSAAARRFFGNPKPTAHKPFDAFCDAEASWLEDWALFAAAKKHFGGDPWWKWPKEIALRSQKGIAQYREQLRESIQVERYVQFRFYQQWERLRSKAAAARIKFIGDIPIYCARDSADVWGNPDLFKLKADGNPKVVSGVPPDYFAKDGQLWGTPVYDWKKNKAQAYSWWISRLRAALRQADIVRIDHFRAFESYWEVPATAPTARTGEWVSGPGDDFFAAVKKALGDAPFIAEDLGIITEEVRALRDRWNLPGMRVLQFAFGEGAQSPHLPIHYVQNCVAYTGTHDNDTTAGWYRTASEKERDLFRRYTASDGSYCHFHMMRLAYGSVADLAVVPMQDVLGLGGEARMNTPAIAEGNWGWKLVPEQLTVASANTLRDLAETFGRLPRPGKASQPGKKAAAA